PLAPSIRFLRISARPASSIPLLKRSYVNAKNLLRTPIGASSIDALNLCRAKHDRLRRLPHLWVCPSPRECLLRRPPGEAVASRSFAVRSSSFARQGREWVERHNCRGGSDATLSYRSRGRRDRSVRVHHSGPRRHSVLSHGAGVRGSEEAGGRAPENNQAAQV